ncbi:hypothetical protein FXF50_11745 [Micromonospora sp. AP08]|uniref:hypothetical protein n=1 Tax=Micromonospora sp. AP08 TaxID=2604467 RepID=UPI0011D716CD|nr:hypothetical protein [Micromonospora sp. AP08]TYB38309.1 hypothetical protein FXF50_11745 [Micromonospora sp. AP08]
MITVERQDLGIPAGAKPFANGAVGELFHIPRPVSGLPGGKLVYKRVKDVLDSGVDRRRVLAQMRAVVELRDRMTPEERAAIDEVTVWPLAMVAEKRQDTGVVIPLIADEFFLAATPPDRPLFEIGFLCVSPNYFTKRGIDPAVTGTDVMRLALAMRLAYAIEVVHRHPVVFGDLHLKNAVATTRPVAQVLLMDCDGIARLDNQNRLQLHGIGFQPPEIRAGQQKLQDQETDVYKLGLCIVKMLSPGAGATQASDPAKTAPGLLDAEGVDMLRRAVGTVRADRPKAWELTEYLVRRVRSMIQMPEILSAELSQRVVLRGASLFVRWRQRHGTEVRIYGANGFTIAGIDPTRHHDGYAIQPPTGGPIDVEVWNEHGPVRVRAGEFDYYELPSLDIAGQLRGVLHAPVPDVPALRADVLGTVEPYPIISTPDLRVDVSAPTLAYPAVSVDLGQDAAARDARAVGGIHRAANEILTRAVSEAMTRLIPPSS